MKHVEEEKLLFAIYRTPNKNGQKSYAFEYAIALEQSYTDCVCVDDRKAAINNCDSARLRLMLQTIIWAAYCSYAGSQYTFKGV